MNAKRLLMMVPLLAVAFVAATNAVRAASESSRDMLDQARKTNEARKPSDAVQVTKMTLYDAKGGSRVRDLVTYLKVVDKDTTKTISFFREPADVRGISFLSFNHQTKDADQWLYTPDTKRVQRIASGNRTQSFQGSDISYEDVDLMTKVSDWTEKEAKSKLLKDSDAIDGFACAVIELIPQEKALSYGKLVIWLQRDNAVIRKVEMYDRADGKLSKVLKLEDVKNIGDIPTPQRAELKSLNTGTRTVIEIVKLQYNKGLKDDLFNERNLERGEPEAEG